jgi:hypothetical protein
MHPFFRLFFVLLTFAFGAAAGAAMVNAGRSGGKRKAKMAKLEARIEVLERKP